MIKLVRIISKTLLYLLILSIFGFFLQEFFWIETVDNVYAVEPDGTGTDSSLKEKIFSVQVASFPDEDKAFDLIEKLKIKGIASELYYQENEMGDESYLVLVGFYDSLDDAKEAAIRFQHAEKTVARIVLYDPGSLKKKPEADMAVISEEREEDKDEDEIEAESPEFSINGFIEFENFINTYTEQYLKDANVKNEIRNKLQVRYGFSDIYFFSTMNFYLVSSAFSDELAQDYFYSDESDISRNGRMTSENVEICLNELYLNYGKENYRLRVGNQIFRWGTADLTNPTSYFNPMDMRELIFKGEDEITIGIPSVSGMLFLEEYTFEVVFSPVHVASVFPSKDSYWDVDFGKTPMDFVIKQSGELEIDPENAGIGARLSTSRNGMDISISGYHGPDREAVLVPERIDAPVPNGAFLLTVQPEYSVASAVGFDFSKNFGDVVIQCETAYYFDKCGVVDQDLTDAEHMYFPFKTKKSQYLALSAGFNYFVPLDKIIEGHDGYTVLTVELALSKYFDDDIVPSFLGNLIALRLDDSYFDDRIKVSLSGLYEFASKGFIFWPSVDYDFQNGITLHLSYADISGSGTSSYEMDNVLYNFRKKDVIMLGVRYDY